MSKIIRQRVVMNKTSLEGLKALNDEAQKVKAMVAVGVRDEEAEYIVIKDGVMLAWCEDKAEVMSALLDIAKEQEKDGTERKE